MAISYVVIPAITLIMNLLYVDLPDSPIGVPKPISFVEDKNLDYPMVGDVPKSVSKISLSNEYVVNSPYPLYIMLGLEQTVSNFVTYNVASILDVSQAGFSEIYLGWNPQANIYQVVGTDTDGPADYDTSYKLTDLLKKKMFYWKRSGTSNYLLYGTGMPLK